MFDQNVTVADLMAEEAALSCQMDLLSVSDLRMDVAGKTLLDIPSMCIAQGGPTVIMGPNGAGKSLLLRVLHGLAVASAGSIRMRGQVLDANLIRRQAMVFQSPVILRRSVRANVEYALAVHGTPRRARRDEAMRLLSIAALQDRAQQPARSLSGGEQQKLALMRALATKPEILFLDEPTSNLDPGSVQSIEKLLMNASEDGTKIVLVTHDVGQAQRLGEEVIFLHRGRLTEQTPIMTFTNSPMSGEATAYLSGELLT